MGSGSLSTGRKLRSAKRARVCVDGLEVHADESTQVMRDIVVPYERQFGF